MGARLQIFKKLRGHVWKFLKNGGGGRAPPAPMDGTPMHTSINNLCKNIRGSIFSRIELTELYALVEIIYES